MKDDSGSYAVFTEQGSSVSQNVMDILSYQDCQGAQDMQRMQYLLKPR